MIDNDELFDDVAVPSKVFFQFDDEDPIFITDVTGKFFSIILQADELNTTAIEFLNGKGKRFKIFMK